MIDDVWDSINVPTEMPIQPETFYEEKKLWIFESGSSDLKELYCSGYNCETRYLTERIQCEYPGFVVSSDGYVKQDSPTIEELKACRAFPNAYCAFSLIAGERAFVVDSYLGRYRIVKQAEAAEEVLSVPKLAGLLVLSYMLLFLVTTSVMKRISPQIIRVVSSQTLPYFLGNLLDRGQD